MAQLQQILTTFTPELVLAICDHVQVVSDHCLGKQIIISEVYEEILRSTTTSDGTKHAARTLLIAVKDAVAVNQTLFEDVMEILRKVVFPAEKVSPDTVPRFMQEMERQYQDLESHSRSRRTERKRDPAEMEVHVAAPLKISKSIADNQPNTVFIVSRYIIIGMFAEKLISATSTSIVPLCDQYVANGLISKETYRRLCETKVNSKEDKAKKSLKAIMETIENDDRCFDLFLTILNRTLPFAIGSELVDEITKESKKYTVAPLVNGSLSCSQASKVNKSDVRAKYQEATAKLDKANRDIKKLNEDLELEIQENKKLKQKLSKLRAEGHEKENAEEIEKLKEKITERKHEISRLRKKVKEKEKEVEFWDMTEKRERELFQEENGLPSFTKVKELEMELREKLEVRNQTLKKEFEKLRQTKGEFREDNIKLEKETDDLQKTKNSLSQENDSLQSKVTSMRELHSGHMCIRRSRYNPCYCEIMGRSYCPRRHT